MRRKRNRGILGPDKGGMKNVGGDDNKTQSGKISKQKMKRLKMKMQEKGSSGNSDKNDKREGKIEVKNEVKEVKSIEKSFDYVAQQQSKGGKMDNNSRESLKVGGGGTEVNTETTTTKTKCEKKVIVGETEIKKIPPKKNIHQQKQQNRLKKFGPRGSKGNVKTVCNKRDTSVSKSVKRKIPLKKTILKQQQQQQKKRIKKLSECRKVNNKSGRTDTDITLKRKRVSRKRNRRIRLGKKEVSICIMTLVIILEYTVAG